MSLAAAAALTLCAAAVAAPPATPTQLLDRAHAMHEALERIPVRDRRPAQYEAIADVLTAVWRQPEHVPPSKDVAPTPAEEALFADGGLHIALAQDLRDPVGWREAAFDFRRLLRRFPGTRYRRNAEWALAQIEWFHLGARAQARRHLADFLRRYPADPRAAYAQRELRGRRVGPPQLLPSPARETAAQTPATAPARPAPAKRTTRAAAEPAAPQAPTHPTPAAAVAVTSLEWHAEPHGLTLVIGLSGRPRMGRGEVKQTHAVYFDFAGAHFAAGMANRFIHLSNPLVSEIELARFEPGVIRLALHERGDAQAVSMYFPNPSRLVVSLQAGTAPPATRKTLAHVRAHDVRSHPAPPRRIARAARPLPSGRQDLSRALGLKVRRIVIDPGHGGFDTGAIGPNGLDEKTVTLSVALRLGRLLQQRLGVQVIYTRTTDVFVPLQERTEIANKAHADLFISIHANASTSPEATGVAAYYLNLTRNPRALEVAARENATTQLGNHALHHLLNSIAQNDKRQESADFCRDVDLSLAHGLDEVNRGVKSAPFIVLIGAHMPSVLAEVSFLSNPHYARLLAEPGYRQRIAVALYHGIARYIRSLGGVQPAPSPALAGR